MSESESKTVFMDGGLERQFFSLTCPDVTPGLGYLHVGQFAQVLDYRQTLESKSLRLMVALGYTTAWVSNFGSAINESLGTFPAGLGIFNEPIGSYASTSPPQDLIDVRVPSLQGPYGALQPGYFGGVQDICSYLWVLACTVRDALQKQLLVLKRELRRVTAVVAILRKARRSVTFFCSVRWERRRWFLHHGARPPKASARAILSLFAEACSGLRTA
jgi:hypothetical protein